ncbi:DUF535 domain-containing protein [Aliivibrio fischeri]|uniref:VirK/YbjX family protein n=1 Tax=Aliivibrio fischeri TaxID=668 RepID=UPI0012D99F10|nr:DUF535 family protein [Aliivibrio fischeri]MUK30313.1 DUF535 domain-containing protein [Aliivibrio fischeri]MUK66119.1 DUF535 domain-containing protein [Aliivibrio fischeri]MUK94688.1 DUF535 domain-containing protein [Aliivibrio fischeri]
MSIIYNAKNIYSENSIYRPLWVYRSKFIIRAIFYYRSYKYICNNIPELTLKNLCNKDPRFLEKPFRPYVINGIKAIEKANFITNHFLFVSTLHPYIESKIYNDINGLLLFIFKFQDYNYSFRLKYLPRYQKEGDMSLVLCDEMNINFYTLTFSINYVNGSKHLIIGGLQGPASNHNNNQKIKLLTKSLHGQRPKDLIVKIITIIANVWQIDALLAVKQKHHIYSAKRYTKGKVKMDYDKHWIALGGHEFNKYCYILPMNNIQRSFENIPRNKRTMYHARYEWLDNTSKLIKNTLI